MEPQKTQARTQLGILIKRTRRQAGMAKQDDLAAATGLSKSVISLAERGVKVEPTTLRLIEHALRFPPGSFEDYIAGRTSAVEVHEAAQVQEKRLRLETMTLSEFAEVAELVANVKGESRLADELMEAFLQRRAARTSTESGTPEVG